MKGQPNAPQCGFSAKAVGILSSLGVPYHGVDVLADAEIRDGIKLFGNWPTIPQLYIDGELVGGSDIIEQVANRSEEHTSELQSLMRISYAVFCLKKKITNIKITSKMTVKTI